MRGASKIVGGCDSGSAAMVVTGATVGKGQYCPAISRLYCCRDKDSAWPYALWCVTSFILMCDPVHHGTWLLHAPKAS